MGLALLADRHGEKMGNSGDRAGSARIFDLGPYNATMAVCKSRGCGGCVNRLFQRAVTAKRTLGIAFISGTIAALAAQTASPQFPPAPGTGPGLPETIEAIDSSRVTTRILYITAHPDDESATLLTYLARGLHADVALLTLTRGEGGQN